MYFLFVASCSRTPGSPDRGDYNHSVHGRHFVSFEYDALGEDDADDALHTQEHRANYILYSRSKTDG